MSSEEKRTRARVSKRGGLSPADLREYLEVAAEAGAESLELELPGGVRVLAKLRAPEPAQPRVVNLSSVPGLEAMAGLEEVQARLDAVAEGINHVPEKKSVRESPDRAEPEKPRTPPESDLAKLAEGTGHAPEDLFASSG